MSRSGQDCSVRVGITAISGSASFLQMECSGFLTCRVKATFKRSSSLRVARTSKAMQDLKIYVQLISLTRYPISALGSSSFINQDCAKNQIATYDQLKP